ncbi:uncharacterized protein LOC125711317 isoform X1 [Brienomyrus brachyistius]|uniref:uncharacterized protein LOC125711317 isoform X1 n=1 Tax=Brienomyrus brachyistius TaxID=42636 RepID=UPI0020B17DE1|nr:uncharacterized protein LOC125711317 isoform X1 [Brienomyrus brachyistius]XP_048836074.1 uncharacterized protein LOC125711317 isoform X1 [Brienomyrus brachyistius]
MLVKGGHYPVCTQTVLVHLKVGVHFAPICLEIIHRLNRQGRLFPFHVMYVIRLVFTQRQYFEQFGAHLKKYETVRCVFKDCDYSTNVYSTFASHKSRKHNPHCIENFKHTVIQTCSSQATEDSSWLVDESDATSVETLVKQGEDLGIIIVDKIGSLLLKLDCIFNVPSRCIDEIVEELQFITCSASAPVIRNIVYNTLVNHNCTVEELVITDLVNNICQLNPLNAALSEEGPLGTANQRNRYLKEHFCVVESVEYILNAKEGKTFQYVPILQSLSQILTKYDIEMNVLTASHCGSSSQYTSFVMVPTSRKTNFCLQRSLDFHFFSILMILKFVIP